MGGTLRSLFAGSTNADRARDQKALWHRVTGSLCRMILLSSAAPTGRQYFLLSVNQSLEPTRLHKVGPHDKRSLYSTDRETRQRLQELVEEAQRGG